MKPLPHEPVSYRWRYSRTEWAWHSPQRPGEFAVRQAVFNGEPLHVRLGSGAIVIVKPRRKG